MNIQSKLDQFRSDNPYDADTQAKRLLASDDKELILYVLALGLTTAKQRQRHYERDYIKNIGEAPPQERLVPARPIPSPSGSTIIQGRASGTVTPIKVKPSKRLQNAMRQLIVDIWRIGGEMKLGDATAVDLTVAIKRENSSSTGHDKNAKFYGLLKDRLGKDETVRTKWNEGAVKKTIETVYGEFRKSEAA